MNKFSGEINTPEGRMVQLATIASIKFSGGSSDYLDKPAKEFGNKTPKEVASESFEGLVKAIRHLNEMGI